ncbi:MAG: hypothetical protein R6U32_05755 [Candidatus Woesearchaeota archaeon]
MADRLTKKELKRYIEEQLDSGHTVGRITEHLVNHGHSAKELDSIFDEILNEEEARKRGFMRRASELIVAVIFVIFVFWVGVSSGSPGEAVFIGFLPSIIFVITAFVVFEKSMRKDSLSVLPLVLAFLFYISGRLSNADVFSEMEVAKLAFLNIILCYVFLLLMYYAEILGRVKLPWIPGLEEQEEKDLDSMDEPEDMTGASAGEEEGMKGESGSKQEGRYIELPEKHESLKKVIHSIESNCKALNSVIGRVYRKGRGGTSLVRDLIQVKPEWYNEFNDILKSRQKTDPKAVYDAVDRIEKRLNMLFRKEHEVFGSIQFRDLKREPNGNNRIIDVLIMNDNDPVQSYLENALKACGEAKEIAGSY